MVRRGMTLILLCLGASAVRKTCPPSSKYHFSVPRSSKAQDQRHDTPQKSPQLLASPCRSIVTRFSILRTPLLRSPQRTLVNFASKTAGVVDRAMTLRLFVVPISTRRALIYARVLRENVSKERSILDRVTDKAAQTWAKWEEADKGWKMHLVSWGNRVQQRIPYEEWGLKSIPSLSSQQRLDKSHGTTKMDVLFPGNAIKEEKLIPLLHKLSEDRQELHRRRMWWSFVAAPITAPIALIPVYVLKAPPYCLSSSC